MSLRVSSATKDTVYRSNAPVSNPLEDKVVIVALGGLAWITSHYSSHAAAVIGLCACYKVWKVMNPDKSPSPVLIRKMEPPPVVTPIKVDSPWLCNLQNPDSNFTGRTQELDQIKAELDKAGKVVLYGISGSGKTELALKYAQDHQNDYGLIWTISCSTKEDIKKSYKALAEALRVEVKVLEKTDSIAQKVHEALDKSKKPWLLIFDDLNKSLPFPSMNGHILITSKTQDPKITSLLLKPFSEEDALLLIGKQMEREIKPSEYKYWHEVGRSNYLRYDGATKLAKLCDYQPYLLSRAAANIGSRGDINEYIEKLAGKQSLLLLSQRFHTPYPKTMKDITLETFKALPKRAQTWLLHCIYFGAESTISLSNFNQCPEFSAILSDLTKRGLIEEIWIDHKPHLAIHKGFYSALKLIEENKVELEWAVERLFRHENQKDSLWSENARALIDHPSQKLAFTDHDEYMMEVLSQIRKHSAKNK